ncbi:MAG TPA: hypothetical protein VJN70_08565, partial [Gemmatimonadaceae bacterium]|nr:hypothetical protein [Gemmatimonadaceae bacterium]
MDAARRAQALLDEIRRTPMLRGGRISESKRTIRDRIANTIEGCGVLPQLADRVAFQLVLKIDAVAFGTPTVWTALGHQLRRETEELQLILKLVERQLVVALPKMSADQAKHLYQELQASDPTIARTIFNAALDAAEPVPTARRYLKAFHRVTRELKDLDPSIARTVANATFMAQAPGEKALEHLRQFAALATQFEGDVEFVRTVARAAFRAPNPLQTAHAFVADYECIVAELTSKGLESEIARSIAGIASVGADPLGTARRLLRNFEDVVALATKTHPWIARSIALSACRASDPTEAARVYMHNYDAIVNVLRQTDPERAHIVAGQAFRSHQPLRWAMRYLKELKQRYGR